jgi:hypothetical protein
MPVCEKNHGKCHSHDEKANVSHICLSIYPEFAHKGHGTGNDASDKASCAYQLANSHSRAVGTHGGKRAEYIRGSVAKGKKGDAGETFAKTKNSRNGAQIDAEEVAGCNANSSE